MRALWILATMSLALVGLVQAEHSYTPCSNNVISIGAGDAMLYLVPESDDSNMWIYAESNGHPGLQRGGVGWYERFGGWPDSCWDIDAETGWQVENPDFIVL